MRKRLALTVLGVLFLIAPTATSALTDDVKAQIVSLLSQIQTLMLQLQALQNASSTTPATVVHPTVNPIPSTIRACPVLSRSLAFGSTGDDVANLQPFLIQQGFLEAGSITAYFGVKTEAAVKAFQTQQGVSPLGIVGPATRAAIARLCAPPTCPGMSSQSIPMCYGGTWAPVYDLNHCQISWQCNVGGSASSTPPAQGVAFSASPTSGVSPLSVNFTARPSVDAGAYSVDFGDGISSTMQGAGIMCISTADPGCSGIRYGASHTYATAGTYTAKLMACPTGITNCSSVNQISLASTVITVTSPSVSSSGIPQFSVPTNITLAQSGVAEDHGDGFYITLESISISPLLSYGTTQYTANFFIIYPRCAGWPSDPPGTIRCMLAVAPLRASLALGQSTTIGAFIYTLLAIDSQSARIAITAAP